MKIKKKLLFGITALSASLALISCGDKGTTYTVSVDKNDGNTTQEKSAKTAQDLITALGTPTRDGYTFGGWYTDSTFDTLLTKDTVLSNDLVIYAKWTAVAAAKYTITVDTLGGTTVANKEAATGAELKGLLPTVTRTGYTFVDWYMDDEFTTPLTTTTVLTQNTTIYAKWTANEYVVTFETNGGSAVSPITVKYNNTLATTAGKSTKDLYDLEGWYTDSACTNKFTLGTTKVTASITLYAKWTLTAAQISTADQLVDYLNSATTATGDPMEASPAASTTYTYANSAVLTADIDMSTLSAGKVIYATGAANCKTAFDKILDGQGYTISNLNMAASAGAGLFTSLKSGANIRNIVFENVTMAPTASNASLIAGSIDAGINANISNITVCGLTFTGTNSTSIHGILVGKCNGTLNANNITVVGDDAQNGVAVANNVKYFGLVGQVTAAGNVNVSNVMMAIDIAGYDQGAGGIIGQIHSGCSNTTTINIDGVVFAGSVTTAKNIGALIGDGNGTGTVIINISNVLIYAQVSQNVNGMSGYLIGQQKNAASTTYTNCQIVDGSYARGLDGAAQGVVGGSANLATGVTVVASDLVTMPNENFEINEYTVSFKGYSVVLPEPITEVEVAKGTIASDNGTADAQTLTIDGVVNWVSKAAGNTQAGNKVVLTITADSTVTDFTNGTYVLNGKTVNIPANGIITIELFLTQAMIDGSLTITVQWNEGAIAQEYTVEFAQTIELASQPVAGEISTTDAQITASSVDGNKVTITEGSIAWNAGNFVIVEVARPDWSTSTTVVPTVSSKSSAVLNQDGTAAIITVPVSAGSNTFTVAWETDQDAQSYIIDIKDSVSIAANPVQGATNYSWTAASITGVADGAALALDKIDTTGVVTAITGVTYKTSPSVELGKAGAGTITFTITDTCEVILNIGSTGGTNVSSLAIYKSGSSTAEVAAFDSNNTNLGASASNVVFVYATSYSTNQITYTLAAGTYTIKTTSDTSPAFGVVAAGTTTSGRGTRISALSIITKTE